MKIFKKLASALMVLPMLAALTGCESEAEYTAPEALTSAQVFFGNDLPSTQDIAIDGTSFDVPIHRANKKGELTVAISSEQDEENIFTIPTSVTFPDGAEETNLTITYPEGSLEYDVFHSITLKVAEDKDTTPYGNATYTFQAGPAAPWTDWVTTSAAFADQGGQGNFPIGDAGTGDYTYSSVFFGPGDDPGLPISFRQNKLNPNKGEFKIEHWGYNVDLILRGEWDEANGFWRISVPLTFTGYVHSSYGNVYFGDWAAYYEYTDREPPTWEDLYAIDQAGTYDPNSGLFRLFVRYFVEAGSFGGDYEYFQVNGFYVPDYSASATFAGILKTASEENQAVVDFAFGVDVAGAKYAMTDASVSEAAAAAAIASGEIEAIDAEAGRNYIPLEEDGKYRVTIVTYDADGEAQGSASTVFEFEAGGSSWESLGLCSYTDDLMGGIFTNIPGPITYDVEVLASTKTPGLYRMKNPYGEAYPYNDPGDWDDSMDYYIEIDASDPNAVTFAAQELGVDWGYGMISAVAVETGKLENGVITFPENAFYLALADYNDGNWSFYGNKNGAFKLVLPGSSVKAKASAKKVGRISHNINESGKISANKALAKTKILNAKLATLK